MNDITGLRQRRFRGGFQQQQNQPTGNGGTGIPPTGPDNGGQKQDDNTADRNSGNEKKPKRSKKSTFFASLAVLLIVVFAGLTSFFAWKYFSEPTEEEVAAQTTERIVEKAGKLFDLPKGEEPTVAQVQDKSKLNDQAFFDNAKNGDYLLLYEKARLAVLYREESNRLVNVGPVNIPQATEPDSGVAGESTEKDQKEE